AVPPRPCRLSPASHGSSSQHKSAQPDTERCPGRSGPAKMDPVSPPPPAPPATPGVPGLAAETIVYKAARDKANASNDAYEQAKITLAALKQVRDADN